MSSVLVVNIITTRALIFTSKTEHMIVIRINTLTLQLIIEER